MVHLQRFAGNRAVAQLMDSRGRTASPPARPVVQRMDDAEMQRIAGLTFEERVEVLSRVSEDDLQAYYGSAYHGNNYLAGEESDEIRSRRRKLAKQARLSRPDDMDELISMMSQLAIRKPRDAPEGEGDLRMRRENADDLDVFMTDVDGVVDVSAHNVRGHVTINFERIHGSVAMDLHNVVGDVTINVSRVGGEARFTLADVNLEEDDGTAMDVDPTYEHMSIDLTDVQGLMEVEMTEVDEPMDLDFGPVATTERLVRAVKRKAPEPGGAKSPKSGRAERKRRRVGEHGREGVGPSAAVPSSSPELDDLIDGIGRLSVSFKTPDGKDHSVYPDDGGPDVIVASTPVPLSTILANNKWHTVTLSTTAHASLTLLQTTAVNAWAAFKNNRGRAAGKTLRNALRAIATGLKNAAQKVDIPATSLVGSTNYSIDAEPTEGTKVVANPLSLWTKTGHKPKDGRLMKAIRAAAGTESKGYKQMHLLNDNLGGPGQLWNLTPGPGASNSQMEPKIEKPLKRAVMERGKVLSFTATVKYRNDPMTASDQDLKVNPDNYRFDYITFTAKQWSSQHGQGYAPKGSNTDPDIKAVDGETVHWDWGGLTPLMPKPRVTKEDDWKVLVAAGIPKGAAMRIAAYNKLYDYSLSGGKKKEQLAQLVQDSDGKRKIDTSWDASRVLWS